jgi:hypothetical protein
MSLPTLKFIYLTTNLNHEQKRYNSVFLKIKYIIIKGIHYTYDHLLYVIKGQIEIFEL